MKIRKIRIDHWEGNRVKRKERTPTGIDQVLAWLDQLDGDTHTELSIEGPEAVMNIGGGPQKFNIFVKSSHGLATLLDPFADSSEKVDLVTGGQKAAFAANIVVNQERAEEAIRYFASHCEPDPGLAWDRKQWGD